MQATKTIDEGLRKAFRVNISKADIEARVVTRLKDIGKNVKMPGFRPGKVPMPILKQRYGQSVLGEVFEQIMQESASKTIEENELKPAGQPKVEDVSFEEGTDLEYTLEVETLPEFELLDFSTLKLERPISEVDDAAVDEALERIRTARKVPTKLKRKRKSRKGDMLTIDFKGSVDGETRPGMEAEDYDIELGSGRFIDTFEDQLVGKNIDEEVTVNVTFPADYGEESLAGREAVFEVKVKNIQDMAEPELDDDFAKMFGKETVAELRELAAEQLGEELKAFSRQVMKRKLLDELADRFTFELPPRMVDQEFEQIWQRIEQARENDQLTEEDKAKSEDELKAEYRAIAERRVRLGLVLSEVGQKNEIEVGQEELSRAMLNEARRYPGQEGQVLEYFQKNPQALAEMRAPIFEEKVVDFVIEMAEVTNKTMPLEELRKLAEAGDDDGPQEKETA